MAPRTLEHIGTETIAIVNAGGYDAPSGTRVSLRDDIDRAIGRTTVYVPTTLHDLVTRKAPPSSTSLQTSIACWNLRSGASVARLLEEGARRVAVLNYANGVKPGGGFLHGARAQEEALCRCSALYACLTSPHAKPYFTENRRVASALVTDHMIVSHDVPFFRDEDLTLREHPFHATVITAAAPDLGWLLASTTEGHEPRERFDEVPAVFRRRTLMVLAAAHNAGCDALVIGPWGCGAFGNDADVVADAFGHAIDRYADVFERVVCSTWGPDSNRASFERRFKPGYVVVVR
jgi:uncharacterized protein (TIGR02452 family)